MIRQGAVHEHVTADQHRYRLLVVSGDAHNQVRPAWVAPIRHGMLDAPPYRVALSETDPLSGYVDLDRLVNINPTGPAIALATGATMDRIRSAIGTIFAG